VASYDQRYGLLARATFVTVKLTGQLEASAGHRRRQIDIVPTRHALLDVQRAVSRLTTTGCGPPFAATAGASTNPFRLSTRRVQLVVIVHLLTAAA
jgi:hypothetical protein